MVHIACVFPRFLESFKHFGPTHFFVLFWSLVCEFFIKAFQESGLKQNIIKHKLLKDATSIALNRQFFLHFVISNKPFQIEWLVQLLASKNRHATENFLVIDLSRGFDLRFAFISIHWVFLGVLNRQKWCWVPYNICESHVNKVAMIKIENFGFLALAFRFVNFKIPLWKPNNKRVALSISGYPFGGKDRAFKLDVVKFDFLDSWLFV